MKSLVIANWKCNPTTLREAKQLFSSVHKGRKNVKNVEVIVCPPFVYLATCNLQAASCKLGAQDCFWENKGAYTGEVSPLMLKNIGCQYVIVGHSERRKLFGETDEAVNKKIKAVISAKLRPILCVGETSEQRNRGETVSVLKAQIISALKNVSGYKFQVARPVIAYEPRWAIGTGKPCSCEEALEAAIFLRREISRLYSRAISEKIAIVYGGSVKSKNAAGYIQNGQIQGLLVGGASLDADEFVRIVKIVSGA